MEQGIIDSVTLGGSVSASDMTVWGLFLQADWIVKIVILVLILASVWSWAIIFEKVVRIKNLHSSAGKFEESFWSGGSLDDLYERVGARPLDPMTAVVFIRNAGVASIV